MNTERMGLICLSLEAHSQVIRSLARSVAYSVGCDVCACTLTERGLSRSVLWYREEYLESGNGVLMIRLIASWISVPDKNACCRSTQS